MSDEQHFGSYQEDPRHGFEYLTLAFSPSSAPLKQRWRNNGLSADFLGDYVTTFFPEDESVPGTAQRGAEIRSAVSFVANELLENAMKFHDEASALPISIHLELDSKAVRITATNSLSRPQAERFQAAIEQILGGDPMELYMAQMEKNALQGDEGGSGLGFLTMINDYSAQLGWKFERDAGRPGSLRVTTQVSLAV